MCSLAAYWKKPAVEVNTRARTRALALGCVDHQCTPLSQAKQVLYL